MNIADFVGQMLKQPETQKAAYVDGFCVSNDPQVSGSEPLAPNLIIQNFAHYVELTAYPQRSALEPLLTERKG